MTEPELAALRESLIADRERTRAGIAAMTGDFDAVVEAAALDTPDDEHDPEGATIGFERAQVTAVLGHTRAHLADLDAALDRLDTDAYGLCERCGQPIAAERLAAHPAARTCIACAERGEGGLSGPGLRPARR